MELDWACNAEKGQLVNHQGNSVASKRRPYKYKTSDNKRTRWGTMGKTVQDRSGWKSVGGSSSSACFMSTSSFPLLPLGHYTGHHHHLCPLQGSDESLPRRIQTSSLPPLFPRASPYSLFHCQIPSAMLPVAFRPVALGGALDPLQDNDVVLHWHNLADPLPPFHSPVPSLRFPMSLT